MMKSAVAGAACIRSTSPNTDEADPFWWTPTQQGKLEQDDTMGLNMIGPARQDTMTPTTPTSASAASRSSERKPCFCREESLAPAVGIDMTKNRPNPVAGGAHRARAVGLLMAVCAGCIASLSGVASCASQGYYESKAAART